MHDGIEMEKLGIPTATIITHVFNNTAKAMAKMMGVPDFTYGVVRHPLSSLTHQEITERAREAAPQIKRILLEGTL